MDCIYSGYRFDVLSGMNTVTVSGEFALFTRNRLDERKNVSIEADFLGREGHVFQDIILSLFFH